MGLLNRGTITAFLILLNCTAGTDSQPTTKKNMTLNVPRSKIGLRADNIILYYYYGVKQIFTV